METQAEEGRGTGRRRGRVCKSGRDGNMVERVAAVLAPAANVVSSVCVKPLGAIRSN